MNPRTGTEQLHERLGELKEHQPWEPGPAHQNERHCPSDHPHSHSPSLWQCSQGAQDEESDYDVLILTDLPLSIKEEDAVTDAVYDLELEEGVVIAVLFYTKDFWAAPLAQVLPFHQRVQEDGVVIRSQSPRIN
jgi:hypothetical protein